MNAYRFRARKLVRDLWRRAVSALVCRLGTCHLFMLQIGIGEELAGQRGPAAPMKATRADTVARHLEAEGFRRFPVGTELDGPERGFIVRNIVHPEQGGCVTELTPVGLVLGNVPYVTLSSRKAFCQDSSATVLGGGEFFRAAYPVDGHAIDDGGFVSLAKKCFVWPSRELVLYLPAARI